MDGATCLDEIFEVTSGLQPFRMIIMPPRDTLIHMPQKRFRGMCSTDHIFRCFGRDVVSKPVNRDPNPEFLFR